MIRKRAWLTGAAISGTLAITSFGGSVLAADVAEPPGCTPAVSGFNGKLEGGGGYSETDEVDGDVRSVECERKNIFCRTLADRLPSTFCELPVFIVHLHTVSNCISATCLRINGRLGNVCKSCFKSAKPVSVDFPVVVVAAVASD